jgi:hypothetical protein
MALTIAVTAAVKSVMSDATWVWMDTGSAAHPELLVLLETYRTD